MEPVKLTKEKLEEYAAQLKRGEVGFDELMSGLMAVHGATRVEMTPEEFLESIESMGVPLDQIDMSDELRKEFEAIKRGAK